MEEEDYKSKFSLKTWRSILGYGRPFMGQFIQVMAFMATVATIDASMPFLTGYVVDRVVAHGDYRALAGFLAIYLPLIALQTLTVKLFINKGGRIEMGLAYEIRSRAFKRLQELSFSYYDRTSSGWLMARMTSDIGRLSDTIAWGMVDMVWGFIMMFVMALLMFIKDWRLALVCLSVVPPLILISVWFEGHILERFRAVRKANSKVTGAFAEGIRGMPTIKSLAAEAIMAGEFDEKISRLRHSSRRAGRLSSLYLPMVVALGYLGTALALRLGGGLYAIGGISLGTLVSFIFCSTQFFDPITDMARVFSDMQYGQASAERVMSLIDTQPEIVDSDQVREDSGDMDPAKAPGLEGRVSFQDVGFAYRDGQRVLDGFNLEVAAGSMVALVGETGSGKSTIVNLACRFYEPSSGRILIDGVDYRQRSLTWLHSRLGYVLQTPYLFSGSVYENIRYGRLGASDDEVRAAARLVRAEEFILEMEKGYDTEVGEGGNLLSTGQKQLISFARAVLAQPRILVLDEATSSVDTRTESVIQEATESLLAGRTSFVVAHRLSTIRRADIILVLSRGKVIESGNHERLMASRGHYYRLYTNQFLESRERDLLANPA